MGAKTKQNRNHIGLKNQAVWQGRGQEIPRIWCRQISGWGMGSQPTARWEERRHHVKWLRTRELKLDGFHLLRGTLQSTGANEWHTESYIKEKCCQLQGNPKSPKKETQSRYTSQSSCKQYSPKWKHWTWIQPNTVVQAQGEDEGEGAARPVVRSRRSPGEQVSTQHLTPGKFETKTNTVA